MALNTLDIDERIKQGKEVESYILSILQDIEPLVKVDGHSIGNWYESTSDEDMHGKIDAWAESLQHGLMSVQIKYRETGQDVGVAVLRPWDDDDRFKWGYDYHALPWDRDMVNMADIYVVLIGSQLIIAPGEVIKRACRIMVDKLRLNGGFNEQRAFTSRECWGCELRIVKDRGAGYSQYQHKVINYIKPELLLQAGATVLTI